MINIIPSKKQLITNRRYSSKRHKYNNNKQIEEHIPQLHEGQSNLKKNWRKVNSSQGSYKDKKVTISYTR